MTALFGLVAPVFALIGMGALAIRLRLIAPAAVHGMTDFVFYTALPALLFASVAQAPPLRLADIAGSFLAGALALFAVALLLARRWLGAGLAEAALFAINCVYGNTVLLGIPVIDAAYGPEGVTSLLAVIAFHSVVLLPLATVLIEAGNGSGTRGVLWAALLGVVRNPVVVAIIAALAWRAGGLGMPDPVHRFLALIGGAGPPLALFCLGATLPRPSGWSDLREVALAGVFKLAAMPALVAALAWLGGLRGIAFATVVVAAGLPTGANAFLLARQVGTLMETSATTVVVSTALSVGTLTVLLGWLGR